MSAAPIQLEEQERRLYRSLLAEMDTRYQASISDWLLKQVWTIDEASQHELRWPADKIYLLELMDALDAEPMLAIPKSRRMMVTWAVAAWAVWRARYHRNNA